MKRLKGTVSISKAYGGDADYVSITVIDDLSRCEIVEVKLSVEALGQAILGSGCEKCEIELSTSDAIGKRREWKTEIVTVPRSSDAASIRAAVAAFETDGWQGRDNDAKNMHRSRGACADGDRFEVLYERWVPVEQPPPP